jgi:hypothetical protein
MLRAEAQDLNKKESPCNPPLIQATGFLQLNQMVQILDLSKLNSPHFNQEDSAAVSLITRV